LLYWCCTIIKSYIYIYIYIYMDAYVYVYIRERNGIHADNVALISTGAASTAGKIILE
jgi:hypothetical protein